MDSRSTPFLIALAALLVLALAACPPAYAEDEEPGAKAPNAVAQLEPEEIAFLEKKFPEWSKLDPRRKEQIARGILRVRNLSPEERKKLQSRMKRLHEGRKGRRHDHQRGLSIMRLADQGGARILQQLPASVQAQIAGLNVRPSMARMAAFRMAKGKAADAQDWRVSEDELAKMPEPARRHLQQLVATANDPEGGKKRDEARRRLQHMRLMKHMEALKQRLGDQATSEQFLRAFMTAWSEPVGEVVAEITAKPQKFLESVQRTSRGHMDRYDYVKSVWALERFASREWRQDPQALLAAERVVRRLLIDALHADEEKVMALPGYESGRERRQALSKLLDGKGAAGKHRGRDGKRRQRPGGGRKKPK